MKSNKILLALAVAAALGPLTSCNESDDGTTITRTYFALNLLTPEQPDLPSQVTACYYTFNINTGSAKIDMTSENLNFDNVNHSFQLLGVQSAITQFSDGDYIAFKSPVAAIDGIRGGATNVNCVLSGLFYTVPQQVPGIETASYSPRVIAQYDIPGKYFLATFTPDATYRGITTTAFQYQGQEQAYKTKAGSYRVVLNLNTNKADVVLYSVKFAQQAPALILVLKDLDVKFERGAYSISGKDIVPQQLDGQMLTPNESFPFEEFNLRTVSADLTNIDINYLVRNKQMEDKLGNGQKVYYRGSFSGAYVNDPNKPFNPDTPVE